MPPAQVLDRQPGVRLSEEAHNLCFGERFFIVRPSPSMAEL